MEPQRYRAMQLSWHDLTEIEQNDARTAFEEGLREERLRCSTQDLASQFRGLQKALDHLSSEAREMLLTESELASVFEGRETRSTALAVVEKRLREQLDWLEIPGNGRPIEIARQAVIKTLRGFWLARGGDPAIGRLQTDNADRPSFQPNAFNRFLGESLMALDPDRNKHFEVACRLAHSTLRALRREN